MPGFVRNSCLVADDFSSQSARARFNQKSPGDYIRTPVMPMTDSTLKNRLTDAMKDAMRNRDKDRLGVIRMALAEFKRVEVDERIEVDDSRGLALLDKMVKQRRDAASQFADAGRQELADKENAEILVLQDFLPKQLGDDEISAIIEAAITETGAASMRDMGRLMGVIKPRVQGAADMNIVSKLIRARLSDSPTTA